MTEPVLRSFLRGLKLTAYEGVSPKSTSRYEVVGPHCRSAIDKGLPFELRMLEGALEAVMQELGAEITELIDVAVPSLDALVTRVTSPVFPDKMSS